jgi:serine/threonine-protein kinase
MIGLPCADADWPRFSALLEAGLDVPESGQAAWLAALDGGDAHLREGLARVLGEGSARKTAELLRLPCLETGGFSPGARIGPYVLVALLGKGGMGEVWRASRRGEGPRRDVALKLPHPAFLGSQFLRRFARERDVLAALSHPSIAQLYDAGTGEDGHPYLALELVEGTPITAYCRASAAGLAQRIDLIRQVLEALAYAHQRLIVHRDIKPGNVLVTPAGQVKLLDFGIAKLLGGELEGDERLTQMGRLATPAYAAPEQLYGGAITVAADIFSAGALLFELCTGRRPFARVPDSAEAEAAPLASQRADAGAAGMPAKPSPGRELRGDLDAIIGKALALDPASRYPSAEAFEADLRCWRAGLPVRARRIGWSTRARKFVRRNRLAVGLSAVLAVSLGAGTAGIAWQAGRVERQAARATAIKDFLTGLFEATDPSASGKRVDELTARQLLQAGAERADHAFARDPATQVDLFETLGGIFDAIDDFPHARAMWTRRLDIERSLYGPGDERVIVSAIRLAYSEIEALDFTGAQAVLAGIREPILTSYGGDTPLFADWLTERASSLRATPGGRVEATEDLQQAIGIFARHSLGARDTQYYIDALHLLSFRQFDADQVQESLATLQKMRALEVRTDPANKMHVIGYLDSAGLRLERLGKLDSADAFFIAEQSMAARLLGRTHYWYISSLSKRILLAARRGDRVHADALLHSAQASLSSGPSLISHALAYALSLEGHGADGIGLLEADLRQARQSVRDEQYVWKVQASLGEAYDQAGRGDEARAMLKQCRDNWVRYGLPGQVSSLSAQERWGRFLLEHGDMDGAEAELRAVIAQSRDAALAPAALAQADLARIELARGNPAAADGLSAQAAALLDAMTMEYDVRARIPVWMTRARVLLAAGQAGAAVPWAAKAAAAAETYDAPGTRMPVAAHELLDMAKRAAEQHQD